MAKKFRCVKCGNIVDINPSYEVLCCPHCGSRYRNTFYDPYAAQNGGVNQYGAPYIFGSQYGAYPQTTPMGVPAQNKPVEPQAEEPVSANDGYEEDYVAEDAELAVRRLNGKKIAHTIMLILSILALAVVAFVVYNRFAPARLGGTGDHNYFHMLFRSGRPLKTVIADPNTWEYFLPFMFALAAFAAIVLSAMHINVANIRLKEYNEGVDLSSSLKSAKLAGYIVVMLCALVALVYFALYGCGGFVQALKASYPRLTITHFMVVIDEYGGLLFGAVASLVGFVYACYKIADTNKKYSY